MLRGWALVLMFTTITLAGCAGTEKVQDFGTVEAPTIMAGYAYAYDVAGSVEFEALATMDGEVMAENSTSVVIPSMPLFVMQILNTSFGPNGSFYLGAARFADAPNGMSFGDVDAPVFGKLPVAIRKSDLAPFSVTTRQTQQCEGGCRLATTSIEVGSSTPLDPYLDFPLTAGKTWTNHVDLGFGLEAPGMQMIVHSTAVGPKTIQVLNQSVETVHIEHRMALPGGNALIKAMVAEMEANGAEDVEVQLHFDGVVDSYYAESFQNVVRETSRSKAVVDVAFTVEGMAGESHLMIAIDLKVDLSGATLEAEPEMDTAGIAAFLDGAQTIKQPGVSMPDGAYTLELTADKAQFNVADAEPVMFTVAATPAISGGDLVRYTVSDADGKLVNSGTGETFEVLFAKPGLYQVVAQAVNEGGVVQAIDAMVVAADYEATVDLTCGNVVLSALPNSNTCTSAAIPLTSAKGLQGVTITINADNPLAYGGTFRITDDEGTVVEKAAGDGDGFTLEELSSLAIGADGWTATWHREAALLEDASVTMVFDYGPETTPTAGDDAGLALRVLQHQFGRIPSHLGSLF